MLESNDEPKYELKHIPQYLGKSKCAFCGKEHEVYKTDTPYSFFCACDAVGSLELERGNGLFLCVRWTKYLHSPIESC